MAIEFLCDQCAARLKLPDTAAGRRGRCRKCGHIFIVPSPMAEEGEIDLAEFSESMVASQPIAPITPAVNPQAYAPIGNRRITLATHPLQAGLCLGGGALAVLGGLALIVYGFVGEDDWSNSLWKGILAVGLFVVLAGAGLIARGLGVEAPQSTEYTEAIEKERGWGIAKAYGTYLLLFAVFVLNMVVLVPIWLWIFPDPPRTGYAAIGMIGVLLALGELYAFDRLTGRELLGLDLSDRAARTWVIGLFIALAFSIGLFAHERSGQLQGAQTAREGRAQRDAYYERLRDPDVQRGIEAYQQIQALREQRNANANPE